MIGYIEKLFICFRYVKVSDVDEDEIDGKAILFYVFEGVEVKG